MRPSIGSAKVTILSILQMHRLKPPLGRLMASPTTSKGVVSPWQMLSKAFDNNGPIKARSALKLGVEQAHHQIPPKSRSCRPKRREGGGGRSISAARSLRVSSAQAEEGHQEGGGVMGRLPVRRTSGFQGKWSGRGRRAMLGPGRFLV